MIPGIGIYSIINLVNNNIYIGSSVDIRKRMLSHFRVLRTGKHRNSHLQHAYNKYGEDKFQFSTIEVVDKNSLIYKEQCWIDFFNPEYNIIRRADRSKFTDEHKRNLSISHIGNRHSEESKIKIGLASKGNRYRIGKKWSDIERANRKLIVRKPYKRGVENKLYGRKRPSEVIDKAVATRRRNQKPKDTCSCGSVVSAKGMCIDCYKRNYYLSRK